MFEHIKTKTKIVIIPINKLLLFQIYVINNKNLEIKKYELEEIMDAKNLNLESIKKINSNDLTNVTDVMVNVITILNIITTSIAVIIENIDNVEISKQLYCL